MRTKAYITAAAGALALYAGGCSGGPGHCVGSAGVESGVVLVNLDRTGLAIEGYDPVAYFTRGEAVRGVPEHRAAHGGAVYQFASAEHRRMFEQSPERYAPQFGGYCAYAASIDVISPIDPKYWEIVDGRLILQHNQKAWDLWHKDASGSLARADANWPGLVKRNGGPARALINVDAEGVALGGYDPVSYFRGAPAKGDPALARGYQGATYYFVSAEHKNMFEKEPARYVPKYGGFCGYAASINRVSPVDPLIWQLVEGELVLQHTPRAYELFNEDVKGNTAKADMNWPGLSHRRCR